MVKSITLTPRSAGCLETNPDTMKEIHLSYYNCGSDICLTASYQCSYFGFSEDIATSLIQKSVVLCMSARNESIHSNCNDLLVGGSLGPYGSCCPGESEFSGKYMNSIDEKVLEKFFRHRIGALNHAKPDFIAFETFPSLREAEIALEVLKEYPHLECYVSFSCRSADETCLGDKWIDVVKSMDSYHSVFGIGINCSHPDYVVDLVKVINENSSKLSICYPNSGETFDGENHKWIDSHKKHDDFLKVIQSLIENGCKIVGGCCRTDYDTIKSIRNMID